MANDIDALVDMGFDRPKVEKAWKATKGAGLQPAMDWLLAHANDPDVPDTTEDPSNDSANAEDTMEDGEIKTEEQTAQSLVCNDCGKMFRNAAGAELHAARTQHQNFAESTTEIKPLTEEEKQQKLADLKQRLADKREQQHIEEESEKRERERLRRKHGQEFTTTKEELEAKEWQKIMQSRKEEKIKDRLAKEKVLAQIKADKLERQAKLEGKHTTEASAKASAPPQPPLAPVKRTEATQTRLQIRVPQGNPITATFPVESTLSEVFDHVRTQGISRPFTLTSMMPRRTYADDDLDKTLKELGKRIENVHS